MRILNSDQDVACNYATLFLTRSEAMELRDALEALLADQSAGRHEHVNGEEIEHEITVCLYDVRHLDGLDERSRKLILKNL